LLWNDQCYIIHNVLLTIAGLLCTLHASLPSSLSQSFSLPGGGPTKRSRQRRRRRRG